MERRAMSYYKDLRAYLDTLEQKGYLIRVKSQINKDTQLHPLVRLQFRGLPEEQRKAFLFENVVDRRGKRYNGSVAICALAGSSQIYSIGMMCPPEQIVDKLTQAERHSIPPKLVDHGPVQEEVHLGDRLLEHRGLEEFPIPISTPGYDVAPYFSAPFWVTKDPDTGIRNVGTYRAQLKSPTRTGVFFAYPTQNARIHWQKCQKRGIPLEAAIVIGGSPGIGYASVSRFPYGVDELAVAGGIAGEPVEVVKCQTVNLEVPAYAEVVAEGEFTTRELEPEGPFGESLGYVGPPEIMPYFTVKCITHRKNPIWLSFLSQYPPSESSKIRQYANAAIVFRHLKYKRGMEHVLAVVCHEPLGSNRYWVVKVAKTDPDRVWQTLEAVAEAHPNNKVIIAVNEDIDPADPVSVNWAICHRVQPHRDVRIVAHKPASLMDPSLLPPEELNQFRHISYAQVPESSLLLINATMRWPYPPLSLPKKEFMEEALRLWQKEGLPPLKLQEPWWGYNLGAWSEEDEENATRATQGEYQHNSEIQAQKRQSV